MAKPVPSKKVARLAGVVLRVSGLCYVHPRKLVTGFQARHERLRVRPRFRNVVVRAIYPST